MIYAGIDIGGMSIKSGLLDDETNQLVEEAGCPFSIEKSVDDMADDVFEMINSMCKKQGVSWEQLKGIGISVPGSISPDAKTVIHAFNLGYHDAPVQQAIANRFPGIPVLLGNDADIAAMAEVNDGIFQNHQTAIFLTLGTGVGGAVILNGKIFRGGNGNGIEFGHVILDKNGDLCTCGNRGCIETLCSATWLIKQGKQALLEHPDCLIAKRVQGNQEEVSARDVIDSARENDSIACAIFETYLDSLSTAISSLIVAYDPEVIGLGGGVSEAGDFLLEPLRKMVKEKNFFQKEYPILKAVHGNKAGVIGAATLAKIGY